MPKAITFLKKRDVKGPKDSQKAEPLRGHLIVFVILSSNKCSKSDQQPFEITLDMMNNTKERLAIPFNRPVHVLSSAYTRGPKLEIKERETKAVVATYRLEVCTKAELPFMLASKSEYNYDADFQCLRTESSVEIVSRVANAYDEWCIDLMEKLIVGKKYQIFIVADEDDGYPIKSVPCKPFPEMPSIFEAVE